MRTVFLYDEVSAGSLRAAAEALHDFRSLYGWESDRSSALPSRRRSWPARAVLVLSWSFRQAAEWHPIHLPTLLIALGMLAAFLSINFGFAMPGLLQRAFLLLFLSWLAIVAHRLARVRPQG